MLIAVGPTAHWLWDGVPGEFILVHSSELSPHRSAPSTDMFPYLITVSSEFGCTKECKLMTTYDISPWKPFKPAPERIEPV